MSRVCSLSYAIEKNRAMQKKKQSYAIEKNRAMQYKKQSLMLIKYI